MLQIIEVYVLSIRNFNPQNYFQKIGAFPLPLKVFTEKNIYNRKTNTFFATLRIVPSLQWVDGKRLVSILEQVFKNNSVQCGAEPGLLCVLTEYILKNSTCKTFLSFQRILIKFSWETRPPFLNRIKRKYQKSVQEWRSRSSSFFFKSVIKIENYLILY